MKMEINLVDCTLRDGGYYNNWNFPIALIEDYLVSMREISVDYVELGFRTLDVKGFKGGCAYTTDTFIDSLKIPDGLKLAVMVNASELVKHSEGLENALNKLFAVKCNSKVNLVRIACHLSDFQAVLPAATWLKKKGYEVAFNLMQVAGKPDEELSALASLTNNYPIDVLYFADSIGSLNPETTGNVIRSLRTGWHGPIGIHTHDNLTLALPNSLRAIEEGVTWVDGTVTGMGRGPGNAKTEYLVVELYSRLNRPFNITRLLTTIRVYFQPLLQKYKWGSNPYYFLSAKYSIHPTYIQLMMSDNRYNEEDIIAVLEYLKNQGGRQFNLSTLEAARHFFIGEPKGEWKSSEMIKGKTVLILGTGPCIEEHKTALEMFIKVKKPFVIALNAKRSLSEELIDIRVACHPVRLLAELHEYKNLPQPLVIPATMLPKRIINDLKDKEILDFGLNILPDVFEFHENYAIIPSSLVFAYALALTTSGMAKSIYLAGFDGYGPDDPRNSETETIFNIYRKNINSLPLTCITPTRYDLPSSSVYALIN